MLVAVALALMLAPAAADTQQPSGRDLLTLCGGYDGRDSVDAVAAAPSTMACLSYVSGLMDAITSYEPILEMTNFIDNLHHAGMLARLGALPKDASEALAQYHKKHIVNAAAPSVADVQAARLLVGPQSRSTVRRQTCIPEGVTSTGQIALVLVKYLRDHPERLHESRGLLAFKALEAAFPCPKEK